MKIPLVVSAAIFMQFLDSVALLTVLPEIAQALGTDSARLSLAVTIYFLCVAMVMPISGWLADRYGSRLLFQLSILVFVAASVASGFSQSEDQLIAARAIQGLAGGLMTPAARLILLQNFSAKEFVRANLWFSLPGLVGPMIGAGLSGFIATYLSWRYIFFLNVPFGLISAFAVVFIVRKAKLERPAPFDKTGYFLIATTIFCTIAASEIFARDLGLWLSVALAAIALFAGWASWRHMQRHATPLFNPKLHRFATYRLSFGSGFIYRIGLAGTIFLLPVLMLSGFHLTPAATSVLALTGAFGMFLIRPFVRKVLKAYGFRNTLFWNGLVGALSVAVFCMFSAATPFFWYGIAFLICGMSRSLHYMSLATVVFADVPPAHNSQASSFVSTTEQFASAVGTSLAGILLQGATYWQGNASSAGPIQIALAAMAIFAFAAAMGSLKLAKDAGNAMSGHS